MHFDPEEDGITHINIYSKGKTEIGKWLSNFTYSPLDLPEGKFVSIEGYWYYLLTKDERLKSLVGFEAKKLGRSIRINDNDLDENFEEKIKKALDIKLKSNRLKMLEFTDSNLPLAHYYVYGEKVIDAGYKWILEHLELRRSQLKIWKEKIDRERSI